MNPASTINPQRSRVPAVTLSVHRKCVGKTTAETFYIHVYVSVSMWKYSGWSKCFICVFQGPLVRWLKVNFGEAFIAWVHVKALRVFVESVLRYLLPTSCSVSYGCGNEGCSLHSVKTCVTETFGIFCCLKHQLLNILAYNSYVVLHLHCLSKK